MFLGPTAPFKNDTPLEIERVPFRCFWVQKRLSNLWPSWNGMSSIWTLLIQNGSLGKTERVLICLVAQHCFSKPVPQLKKNVLHSGCYLGCKRAFHQMCPGSKGTLYVLMLLGAKRLSKWCSSWTRTRADWLFDRSAPFTMMPQLKPNIANRTIITNTFDSSPK